MKGFNWLAVAVPALIWFLFPVLFPKSYYVGLLVIIGLLTFATMGLDMLVGYVGLLSLGQAAFMATGAYVFGLLAARAQWTPLAALLAALAVSLVLARVIGGAVLKLRGYYLAIATLAFSVIIEKLLVALRPVTGGPSGLTGVPNFSLGPWQITTDTQYYYLVGVLLLAGYMISRNVAATRTGRAFRSIAGDSAAAAMLGIDVSGYRMKAFLYSAAFASVAGSLYTSYMRFISPEMVGSQASLTLVVMLLVGGPRTLIGTGVGVGLITILPQLLGPFMDFWLMIEGIILVLVMIFMRRGLVGEAGRFLSIFRQWLAGRGIAAGPVAAKGGNGR